MDLFHLLENLFVHTLSRSQRVVTCRKLVGNLRIIPSYDFLGLALLYVVVFEDESDSLLQVLLLIRLLDVLAVEKLHLARLP